MLSSTHSMCQLPLSLQSSFPLNESQFMNYIFSIMAAKYFPGNIWLFSITWWLDHMGASSFISPDGRSTHNIQAMHGVLIGH